MPCCFSIPDARDKCNQLAPNITINPSKINNSINLDTTTTTA